MGNCYKKQRRPTPVQTIQQNRLSVEPDDGLPYMLVLNNTSSQTTSSSNATNRSRRFWRNRFWNRRARDTNADSPPHFSFCLLTDEDIDKHVIETLSILRSSAENDTTLILRMRMFKHWANGETGWIMVLSSLIRAVPLDDVLGPSAITLFIDHCPLPSKQAVSKFVENLSLSREKALEEFTYDKDSNKAARHRNVCAILGHLAEALAVPLSQLILSNATLDYFLAGLDVNNCVIPVIDVLYSLFALEKFAQTENKMHLDYFLAGLDVNNCVIPVIDVLYSLFALEKFAQTGDNKQRILATNVCDLLLVLEQWVRSNDYKKRQVGFSAQWLLDNTFVVPGRDLTYEIIDLSLINTMLNCNDVSEYLKISADGLEARSDASSFESVRCTFAVDSGAWYYEVTIVTPGVMQIGWATKDSKFFNYDGYGIGDDEYSCAYDGCRQLYWHCAQSRPHSHPPWKEGDVLGLFLDFEANEVIFSLNGDCLPPESGLFNSARSGIFAAASFMSHQQCIFNFGASPFKFPPKDRLFQCFNDHAHLADEDKKVLPKHKRFEILKQLSIDKNTCDLCCDLPADVILLPCGHGGICHRCAEMLDSCPLCRGEVIERLFEPRKEEST